MRKPDDGADAGPPISPGELTRVSPSGDAPAPIRKKRGGGPRTAEGRARVRLNPLKHGVLSQTPVIPLVEGARDWERLKEGIRAYLGAEGELELALADRISTVIWRLYRVVRLESGSVEQYLKDVPRDFQTGRKLAGLPMPSKVTPEVVEEMDRMLTQRLLPGDETLEKVMRYESRMHRFMLQTLHQYLILKGLRGMGPGTPSGTPDMETPGMPGSARRHAWLPARAQSTVRRAAKARRGDDESPQDEGG